LSDSKKSTPILAMLLRQQRRQDGDPGGVHFGDVGFHAVFRLVRHQDGPGRARRIHMIGQPAMQYHFQPKLRLTAVDLGQGRVIESRRQGKILSVLP
jgi:hypothetical protein